ncbi:unnamed protein product [Linum trigynum]|uniref:Uncharacterized protein n=1 Tax=Linum trigynum TaxID=586398 RepID=A0AAV2DPJ7_9ROSI
MSPSRGTGSSWRNSIGSGQLDEQRRIRKKRQERSSIESGKLLRKQSRSDTSASESETKRRAKKMMR